MHNKGQDLVEDDTRKYRQNVLTRAIVSSKKLWLTVSRTTSI